MRVLTQYLKVVNSSISRSSSNESTEDKSSVGEPSESKVEHPCRFKTRQLACKLHCVEDEYYCTKLLQFGGVETLSGYRARKHIHKSADLFMTYADFILTRVSLFVNSVANLELICFQKIQFLRMWLVKLSFLKVQSGTCFWSCWSTTGLSL